MNNLTTNKIHKFTDNMETKTDIIKKRIKRSWRIKLLSIVIGVILALLLVFLAFLKIAEWGRKHEVKFQTPIIIRTPVWIDDVKPEVIHVPVVITPTPPFIREGDEVKPNKPRSNALDAIYVYFGDDKTAKAIAMAESHNNCNTVSNTSDYGLFQLNQVHLWRFKKQGLDWSNCWDNAKIAKQIHDEQGGWQAWTTYTSGRYLAYL